MRRHWIIKIRLCALPSFQSSSTFLYLSPLHAVCQICRGKLSKVLKELEAEERNSKWRSLAWEPRGSWPHQPEGQIGAREKYLGWRRKRGTHKSPTQSWGHVTHYLDIWKGRVNLANIYGAPTRFKYTAAVGDTKMNQIGILPSRGSQWCKDPGVFVFVFVFAVLTRPLLKGRIQFW